MFLSKRGVSKFEGERKMKKNSLCKMVAVSAAPGSRLRAAICKAINLGICTVYQGVGKWQDKYEVRKSTGTKYIKAEKVEGKLLSSRYGKIVVRS